MALVLESEFWVSLVYLCLLFIGCLTLGENHFTLWAPGSLSHSLTTPAGLLKGRSMVPGRFRV